LKQQWCIPPQANADFVWHMKDVLDVYTRPYDPRYPQVCLTEISTQLLAEIVTPLPLAPGHGAREDYEYARGGTANRFIVCEPLRGWRGCPLGGMTVTARRTKVDWARCIKELVDVHYPDAEKIVLMLDNLNTHTPASLYEAFPLAMSGVTLYPSLISIHGLKPARAPSHT
jgi:hypothetical protein